MSTQQQTPTHTLAEIDQEFKQIGCLGHGGFGSVFLAKKRSGRRVALKFMTFDPDNDDEDQYEVFTRERDALVRLNSDDKSDAKREDRDLGIVFLEEWCVGATFTCIVMEFADGGTLAQEIEAKASGDTPVYTERRIASYVLQLSEALAYAYDRGVAHHGFKSSNVLIDQTGGGRLLLADFGSAAAPGEDSILSFTEIYASPELLAAHALGDYAGLEADKVDAFGLGCIMFELLCCRKLVDLPVDHTLAEIIQGPLGIEGALDSPYLRLPWLPTATTSLSQDAQVFGYSDALRSLVKTLLEPLPSSRWTPSELQEPLRHDPRSPLLANCVAASQSPVPGAHVTVDNIQLGMFVQRGHDWDDGDTDGGHGSIGVIVKLDADAGYTEVAWPSRTPHAAVEAKCYRIGAGNKLELQIGPTPLADFYSGTDEPRLTGVLQSPDTSQYYIGQEINSNCMVVGIQYDQNLVFVAPMEQISVPVTLPVAPICPPAIAPTNPRKPQSPPGHWQPVADLLVEVSDLQELGRVTKFFHSTEGGMDMQAYESEIVSLKRVQSVDLWTAYSCTREDVAAENWGVPNERRLFHATGGTSPEMLIRNPGELYQNCSSGGTDSLFAGKICLSKLASLSYQYCHINAAGDRQVVLSRVALGREYEGQSGKDVPQSLIYHSEMKLDGHTNRRRLTIRNLAQAFPEYVITYKTKSAVGGRRIVSTRPPKGVCIS